MIFLQGDRQDEDVGGECRVLRMMCCLSSCTAIQKEPSDGDGHFAEGASSKHY
jgi:hypothetical protein